MTDSHQQKTVTLSLTLWSQGVGYCQFSQWQNSPPDRAFSWQKACKDLVLLPRRFFLEVTAIQAIINKLFYVLKIKASLIDGREDIDKIIKFHQSELKNSQENSLKYLHRMSDLKKSSEWVYWPLTPKSMQPHQIILFYKGFPFPCQKNH